MKRIIVMNSALARYTRSKEQSATTDEWWAGMPKDFKKKYIKDHPNSKYAKQANGGTSGSDSDEDKIKNLGTKSNEGKSAKADKGKLTKKLTDIKK
jgi:hypothetical protein